MKVGILIGLAKDAITGKQPSYADIKEMALTAEELGFDSIWVYDHLLYRTPGEEDSGIWECWTTLSALPKQQSASKSAQWSYVPLSATQPCLLKWP
jgi:hypothetical protein